MRAWLILTILLIGSGPCAAAVEAVNVYEPRAFGYFIGDTFERRIEVITTGDTELLTAGLPRPGPLTYWLDVISVSSEVHEADSRKTHNITLKYQAFYAALEPVKVKVPAYPLKFRNAGLPAVNPPAPSPEDQEAPGGESAETPPAASEDVASIPAFQLVMSPIREFAVSDFMSGKGTEVADVLAPDAKVHLISMSNKTAFAGASLAVLGLSIILLLWHYAKGPFARRQGRPFTIAERRIRELQGTGAGDTIYKDSLIALHRAFDDAYGRRVFAEDLSAFLSGRPRFTKLKKKLERFFDGSRLFFFSGDKKAAEAKFPIDDVRKLAADLAREEKAAA